MARTISVSGVSAYLHSLRVARDFSVVMIVVMSAVTWSAVGLTVADVDAAGAPGALLGPQRMYGIPLS